MRVISGKYKGIKLKSSISDKTMPTLDRVKEAMFSIINYDINNSVCLDLFSGSGALGIECLSRGANHVVFNDEDKDAIVIIKENLNKMENYQIFNLDYKTMLVKADMKFDIILLDPPFKKISILEIITDILEADILNKDAIIMIETNKNDCFVINNIFTFKEYFYGKIKLTLLKLK